MTMDVKKTHCKLKTLKPHYFKAQVASESFVSLKLGNIRFLIKANKIQEQALKQILSTGPGLLLHSPYTWCFGQFPFQMKSLFSRERFSLSLGNPPSQQNYRLKLGKQSTTRP